MRRLSVRACRNGAHGQYAGAAVWLDEGCWTQGHHAMVCALRHADQRTGAGRGLSLLLRQDQRSKQVMLDVDSTVVTRNGEQFDETILVAL